MNTVSHNHFIEAKDIVTKQDLRELEIRLTSIIIDGVFALLIAFYILDKFI